MSVTPATGASLKVTPAEGASLTVTLAEGSALTVNLAEPTVLKVTPVEGASLTIGEVCSVSPGTIVVLAASDGPLRTRDGGFLLLDPATNPPES